MLAEAIALGIMRAMPVDINDPPEIQLAKCEVYAKRLEAKEHLRKASAVPAKPAPTPTPTRKKVRPSFRMPEAERNARDGDVFAGAGWQGGEDPRGFG